MYTIPEKTALKKLSFVHISLSFGFKVKMISSDFPIENLLPKMSVTSLVQLNTQDFQIKAISDSAY